MLGESCGQGGWGWVSCGEWVSREYGITLAKAKELGFSHPGYDVARAMGNHKSGLHDYALYAELFYQSKTGLPLDSKAYGSFTSAFNAGRWKMRHPKLMDQMLKAYAAGKPWSGQIGIQWRTHGVVTFIDTSYVKPAALQGLPGVK